MTYPEDKAGLTSVGIFTEEGRDADKVRERLASIGMEWFHKCQNERVKQERQWLLNLAFYYGNQHVQFRQAAGSSSFDLYTPKAPPWRTRIVINQTRKIIRKEISRLTAQKPNAFVIPSSTEDTDVFAAQAGEQIWDSLWRRVNFTKTLREAVFWQAVAGNGFIKTYWDPNKKDTDSDKIGDICIDNITPFHIFVPDLMITNTESQPYIIHAQVRNLSWVKQVFGIDATSASLESVDSDMLTAMGISRGSSKKDQTTILEVWVKPNYLPELPDGGMFIIAANQVVQGFDSWPYEHGQYPFAKLDASPTGKFYTSSIVEDLIPLQRELNRSRSQLIEAKNRMSKPQLVAEKGSVDPKKMTTEPGQVIEYAVGHAPPQPLPLQNIPSYVTEEISRLYDDMADISGQHEVSHGSTPPGVTAATAISFLTEQDESLIAGNYSSLEESIEKVAYQSLVYVKMFWDETRLVKIVGTEGTFDVQTFKGSDLRGNSDIRVESGSSLPKSRAAKQAFIMDLMKMGFVPPEEGLELLEVGGLNRIYERIQIDKRQAQRENLKMRAVTDEDMLAFQKAWFAEQGAELQKDPESGLNLEPPLIVPVHTYDNHEVHVAIHNSYRKSQNFENAPDATKVLFEEHVKQHEEAMSGMMEHPLTGMGPNSPETEGEEVPQEPGPEPMPELEGEQPQEGPA